MNQICLSLKVNTSLKYLNLSYNSLATSAQAKNRVSQKTRIEGLSSKMTTAATSLSLHPLQGTFPTSTGGLADSTSASFAKQQTFQTPATCLSASLSCNRTIEHLDLSHCQLSSSDCSIIGEGLQGNCTLVGIHIEGNEGVLDREGFLRGYNCDVQFPDLKGSTCWICNGWTEILIEWTRVHSSGMEQVDVQITTVTVHIEAYNFKPIPMLRVSPCIGKSIPHRTALASQKSLANFAVVLMHPPTDCKFYFIVNHSGLKSIVHNLKTIDFHCNSKIPKKNRGLCMTEDIENEQPTTIRHHAIHQATTLLNLIPPHHKNTSLWISRPRECFSASVYERFCQQWDIEKSIFKERKSQAMHFFFSFL